MSDSNGREHSSYQKRKVDPYLQQQIEEAEEVTEITRGEGVYSSEGIEKWNDTIQKQRKIQRRILFWVAIGIAIFSFVCIKVLVLGKVFFGLIISSVTLNILAVSVFAEVVGLIAVIARYLWDDSPYVK